MTQFILRNDWSHGEINEKLLSKVDYVNYYKMARKIRNAYVIPQGGARRRHGSIFEVEIIANEDEYQLAEFELFEDLVYLVVFLDGELLIYREDSGVLSLKATIVATWNGQQASELKFTYRHNSMVITHTDVGIFELTNTNPIGAPDSSFVLNNFLFKRQPTVDFDDDYDNINFSLTGVAINTSQTLTATAAIFTTDDVGGMFEAFGSDINNPIGVARITAFISSTQVTVLIIKAFDSSVTMPTPGREVSLREPAYSSARGWPEACAFYENRLWFGGGKENPEYFTGSKVGDFRNFDEGQGLADEAITVKLGSATKEVDRILHIVADQSLQIFTSRAEYSPPQLTGEPLTPSTIAIRRHSDEGSEQVSPITLDNQTFFIGRGGKVVNSFQFKEENSTYDSNPVSTLSPQLIRNPVDSAALKYSQTDDAKFLFLVNEDGTLAVYQSLQSENISAWSLSGTGPDIIDPATLSPSDGKYKRIVVLDDTIYVLVLRNINGTPKHYIEKFTFDEFMDSIVDQTFGSPQTVITGLSHLEGEIVRAIGDGFILKNPLGGDLVVSGGQITVDRASTNVKVGLNYNTLVRDVPVNVVNSGKLYTPKRIVRAFIDFVDSIGLLVDGELIPDYEFGPDVFDPLEPKIGTFEYVKIDDWEPRQSVDITQVDPFPMNLIGIGYEVQI